MDQLQLNLLGHFLGFLLLLFGFFCFVLLLLFFKLFPQCDYNFSIENVQQPDEC